MPRDSRVPEPAPGWTPGTCYCGCGTKLKPGRGWWCSKEHRSSRAPDGRPVTEVDTKWCQTCSQRLPLSSFRLRTVRRATGYVERPSFYCETCFQGTLSNLATIATTEEGKERNRQRMADLYADPLGKEMFKNNAAAYRERVKADPEKLRRVQQQRHDYWLRYKKTKAYQDSKKRRNERFRQVKKELRLEEKDPMVISREDPMMAWLYQEIDRFLKDRDLAGEHIFGPILGGRNWGRWRPGTQGKGGKYMDLARVDAVLIRLDLQYRLHDFVFTRRSELIRSATEQPHKQDDDDDQNENAATDVHEGSLPQAEAA